MLNKNDQAIIDQAVLILKASYKRENLLVNSSDSVKRFCQLQIASLEHEVFCVLFLDSQHRLISFSEMFRGTIDGASVYPREVAKEALKHNAAAVILTHNHPSGMAKPSQADQEITKRLSEALALLDIRVLDHIVVSPIETLSFAERGLL